MSLLLDHSQQVSGHCYISVCVFVCVYVHVYVVCFYVCVCTILSA